MRGLLPPLAVVLLVASGGCMEAFRAAEERSSPPGGLALDYLRPAPYSRILVSVHAESGTSPNAQALEDARAVLAAAVGKTVEIRVTSDLRGRGSGASYRGEDLVALEDEQRSERSAGETAVIWAGWYAGRFTESRTLAVAYRGSSLAFFDGTISSVTATDGCSVLVLNPCGLPESRFVQRAVFVHEVGHLLGLVNAGVPMRTAREDPESPGHSTNPQSVMYAAVEVASGVQGYLDSGKDIPYRFDANDQADLDAAKRS